MTTAHPFRRPLGVPDFERMNLPQAYWRAKVQHVAEGVRPMVAKYLLKMDQMVENGVGMLVLGDPGVGKTGIGALVAKEARSRGYMALFVSVWELREMIRSKLRFDDEMSMLQRATDVDVLILDDLRQDDVKQSWFGRAEIEAMIAQRAAQRKLSVVTSQMSLRDLKENVPGLMDSAEECMVRVPVEGPNLREARKAELRQMVLSD